jgi:predicted transcriptional regulator
MKQAVKTIDICEHCDGVGYLPTAAELRTKRKVAGLTVAEVARRMRFTSEYLRLLEAGQRKWNAGLVRRFREAISD